MRSLLFDELNSEEIKAVLEYLATRAQPAGLSGLYWLQLVEGRIPAEPAAQSGVGRLAVEVGDSWLKFELFKRTEELYNEKGGFLTIPETVSVLEWAGRMLEDLSLKVC